MANLPDGKTLRSTYVTCFLAGASGALLAIVVSAIVAYHLLDVSFVANARCGNLANFEYCFFDEKWDSADYLSVITSFYTTIITLAVGLLAIVSAFAFLIIRTSARHHAQDVMEAQVERFFESGVATSSIRTQLRELVTSATGDINTRVETIVAVMEEHGFDFPGTIEVVDETATQKTD